MAGRPTSPFLRRTLPYALLAAVVAAAFAPSVTGGMLRWDDHRIVADNPLVGPPYLSNTAAMFTRIQNEAYQPLHVASYQLDHALWDLHPWGCHGFNVVLYVSAALVLLALLVRLGAGRWAALAGVMLFALHPVHVESVAWITGRKDVLSLLFVALSLFLHVGSRRTMDAMHVGVVVLFVLAALTKTSSLVLVAWFPVIDRLLLGRPWREALARAAAPGAAALVLGVLVVWIWHDEGLTRQVPSEAARLVIVLRTVAHYAGSVVWPLRLSPLYEIDRHGAFDAAAAAGLAVLAALVGGALWLRRRSPQAAAGMWLFLAALVPVSNLVPLFFQVNDRYLLLPTLGLAFVAWGAIRWAETRRAGRAAMAACVVLAVGCGAVSFRDSFSWRSDEALWERATRVRPRSYYAWMKLGETRRDAGEFEAAHAAYTRAVELEPELLPARGGRVLNCLVSEKVGHAVEVEQLERFAPLVSSYLAAAGSSRRTLSVALKMYTRGAPRCALMVMAEGVQYEPAVPDRAILDLARDFGEGRPGGCRLIEHVSEGGRRTPAYRELAEECERMEAGQ